MNDISKMKSKQINEILFCIPVWGDSYVTKFLNFVLPSYFTENNINSMREAYKIRFCLLTDKKGFRKISLNSFFITHLSKSEFDFINIEDLIVDAQHTFTLTMAYARAINSIKSANLGKTLVILANSDFLLSDGSIGSVLNAAQSGAQAIYGASLRCKFEELEPVLKSRKTDYFYNPRNLVSLTLNSLHPTVNAMTVNNGYQHYRNVRQLFFRVDETCLLARNFLLCIIGLVPQRHLAEVNSYHDYSFVPELTDEYARFVISDSDNYFAMELQDANSESQYIYFGELDEYEIAEAINLWSMSEHRWASGNEIIFHSGDIPKDIEKSSSEFGRFYSRIEANLSKKPLSHINHYHWTSGALIWERKAKDIFGQGISLQSLSPTCKQISFFDRLIAIRYYPVSFYKIANRLFYSKLNSVLSSLHLKSVLSSLHLKIAYYFENRYFSVLSDRSILLNSSQDIKPFEIQKDVTKYLYSVRVNQLNSNMSNLLEDLEFKILDLIISRSSINWKKEDQILLGFLNEKVVNSNFKISTRVEGRFLIVIFRNIISKCKSLVLQGRYFRVFRLVLALLPVLLLYFGLLAANILPVIIRMKRQKGSFLHIRLTRR